jgi:hypothetical protein
LPSAFACHVSSPARIDEPFDWIAKSTIVVVPPNAAAIVPDSKSSDELVPPNGMSMCVWQSMPPGMTNLPVASMTLNWLNGGLSLGKRSNMPVCWKPAILSPTIITSATNVSLAVTTVPPLISVSPLIRASL